MATVMARSTRCLFGRDEALRARSDGVEVDNIEGWLLRIAHHPSLDFLRSRSRSPIVPLTEDAEAAAPISQGAISNAETVAIGIQIFMQLPELQRCAVILKDVLGHLEKWRFALGAVRLSGVEPEAAARRSIRCCHNESRRR